MPQRAVCYSVECVTVKSLDWVAWKILDLKMMPTFRDPGDEMRWLKPKAFGTVPSTHTYHLLLLVLCLVLRKRA